MPLPSPLLLQNNHLALTKKQGLPFDEEWSYPAAVGMLLYISSNTRPDIQFAVHQVARFSHSHRKSHGQAIKRIFRYLIETQLVEWYSPQI
jgi:hypothetical protein